MLPNKLSQRITTHAIDLEELNKELRFLDHDTHLNFKTESIDMVLRNDLDYVIETGMTAALFERVMITSKTSGVWKIDYVFRKTAFQIVAMIVVALTVFQIVTKDPTPNVVVESVVSSIICTAFIFLIGSAHLVSTIRRDIRKSTASAADRRKRFQIV